MSSKKRTSDSSNKNKKLKKQDSSNSDTTDDSEDEIDEVTVSTKRNRNESQKTPNNSQLFHTWMCLFSADRFFCI